ncbi:MAG TPA: hypothetical protein VFG86_05860 [Chloroflexota bacterium]|nr:hypothetical protein [Chloroflexota bacterium]
MSGAHEFERQHRITGHRTGAHGRTNLSVHRTRLIGRDRDAAAVRRAVMGAEGRACVLTGPGGSGKTRLAVHVWLELVGAFTDGVWVVELAAARTRALTAQQITVRLDDIFRFLPAAGPVTARHQQTLRGTFDWNYGLLTPAERVLFRRLAVFVAGWTLEAAEVECAGDSVAGRDVLELLARLVDSSERRHAAYFDGLATAGDEMWRGAWETEWLEQMDHEQDTLRAVLQYTRADGDLETHLLLCIRLTRFWEVRGLLGEGQRWLDESIGSGAERAG